MSDQSSLAMAAKAKAMYGKHLKSDDYTELLRKKTVQEIAVLPCILAGSRFWP